MDITWEQKQVNFDNLRPWIDRAVASGCRLIVLPEMFSCGFSMDTSRVAEPPGGPTQTFLCEQAQQHGVWIGGSLPEKPADAEKPFNTFIVAGPRGQVTRYRKIHPFSYANEHHSYDSGDQFVTVDVDGLRCTLFVCYDLRFADEFWATAQATDAYLVVANWPTPRREHWQVLLRARALENQAYVVGVNRVGQDAKLSYEGDSAIVDPWGVVLTQAQQQPAMLVADLDPEVVKQARSRFPVLNDRR